MMICLRNGSFPRNEPGKVPMNVIKSVVHLVVQEHGQLAMFVMVKLPQNYIFQIGNGEFLLVEQKSVFSYVD